MSKTVAVFLVPLFLFPAALIWAQSVPAGGEFELEVDETIAIYGDRGGKCSEAPSFDWVMSKAVTRKPKYGELSDGGVGERRSGRCGKEVPVRIINYTPDEEKVLERAKKKNKTVVKDRVTFWNSDKVKLLIETE